MRLWNKGRSAVPAVDHDDLAAVARQVDRTCQSGRPSPDHQGIDVFAFKPRHGFVSSDIKRDRRRNVPGSGSQDYAAKIELTRTSRLLAGNLTIPRRHPGANQHSFPNL